MLSCSARSGRTLLLLGYRKRLVSTQVAKKLLGLDRVASSSIADLRNAYFNAAKLCHPDIKGEGSHIEFLALTEAYEHLQRELAGDASEYDQELSISEDEEHLFRAACQQQLGVPAEIVEECKRNPIFRKWLGGNTDAAHTWRDFFRRTGGLAPKLRQVACLLGANDSVSYQYRRRRKRR